MMKNLQKSREYVMNISFKNLQKSMFKKISNIGLPTGMQMIFETGIFTAAIWISGALSKEDLSANQIALNLSSLTFMVANGLGITAMIRIGNQLGARNYANLRRVAISVFLLVLCTQVFFAILLAALRNWVPSLYLDMNTTDIEKIAENTLVINEAAKLLLIAAIFQISDGLQVTALGALRGVQDAKVPMYITFVSYWLIAFPILYILGIHTSLGTMGIWIGLLIGLTAAAVCLLYRFNRISLRLIANRHKDN